MKTWKHNNRGLGLFLALALIVHVVFLMAPVAQKMAGTVTQDRSVQVRLLPAPESRQARQVAEPQPLADWLKPAIPVLESLPPIPPVAVQAPARKITRSSPVPDSKQVLSSQFEYRNSVKQPLFGDARQEENRPDFQFRERTTLEAVLNQPSLQLPFEDTRTYLVDSYDSGFMGGMERFWDNVSVPFGFTTKNNTRIQCVWVLVIAGCGWGHKTLFHRPARLREKPKEPAVENI